MIRSGICTGEKTVGFKDMQTGKFEDIMCIRGEEDLKEFMEIYGISPDEIKTEY